MVQILFIYAENCEHCQDALSTIENAIVKCKDVSCQILKFHYDTKPALTIAVNNGIDGLPGFVIGDKVFKDKNYSEKLIIDAIRKASKSK